MPRTLRPIGDVVTAGAQTIIVVIIRHVTLKHGHARRNDEPITARDNNVRDCGGNFYLDIGGAAKLGLFYKRNNGTIIVTLFVQLTLPATN